MIDLPCQSLAERIFRKLDTIDWNEYAQKVTDIEQNKTHTTRDTKVTYEGGLTVSTYELRFTHENGTEFFHGPRIQYSFPLEMNDENYASHSKQNCCGVG